MSPVPDQPVRLRFRAPAGNGEVLAVPELSRCSELAESNARLLSVTSLRIGEVLLNDLREQSRQEVLAHANQTAHEWGLTAGAGSSAGLWIVTGHQPVLAHPGVWVKNAMVSAAAERLGGLGLNLIVDSDLCNSRQVLVPSGTRELPERGLIPFDSPAGPCPWEEAQLQDNQLFDGVGQRLHRQMQSWGVECLAGSYWDADVSTNALSLAALLTRIRVRQERRWGWQNLELPIGSIDQCSGFLRLLAHLIQDAASFNSYYNAAVTRYRRQNGIRNHSHPVPDLKATTSEFELPFWIWKLGTTARQGLSVQIQRHAIQLRAGSLILGDVPRNDMEGTVESLTELRNELKIRPRALATTMFARLLVADLFVHGIGGAKYDEITDDILQTYFQIEPPRYLTLTATLRLPIPLEPVTAEDIRKLERSLRDLHFNPDRQLTSGTAQEIQERKTRLIVEQKAAQTTGLPRRERRSRRATNRARHQAFAELRESVSSQVAAEVAAREANLAVARQALARNQILGNREYAAILYPEAALLELFSKVREAVK